MKPNSAAARRREHPNADGSSLTDRARVIGWTDEAIEEMASVDPDHPPLDDAFWREVDRANSSTSASLHTRYVAERSYEPITPRDLRLLAQLALGKLDEISVRLAMRPASLNRPNLRVIALAQGAALHLADGRNGIKDFDLWAFFSDEASPSFPSRPVWNADFGPSKFGVHPDDLAAGFLGRRVDILGRSISFVEAEGEVSAVRSWLKAGSKSARRLAERPLVAIYPETVFGEMIWGPEKAKTEPS